MRRVFRMLYGAKVLPCRRCDLHDTITAAYLDGTILMLYITDSDFEVDAQGPVDCCEYYGHPLPRFVALRRSIYMCRSTISHRQELAKHVRACHSSLGDSRGQLDSSGNRGGKTANGFDIFEQIKAWSICVHKHVPVSRRRPARRLVRTLHAYQQIS